MSASATQGGHNNVQKKDNSTTHYHTLQKFKYLTALFVKHCIKYAVICAKSAEPILVVGVSQTLRR